MATAAVAAGLLACASCSHPRTDLMPLAVGEQWGFAVRSAQNSIAASLKVTRKAAVGGVEGFEISGPSGISRLAWIGGDLKASVLSGTRFMPPITLLTSTVSKTPVTWSGKVSTPLHSWTGTAENLISKADLKVAGRNVDTIRSDLVITLANQTKMTLTTWYAPEMGIVRQEQRTNGVQVLAMERLNGP